LSRCKKGISDTGHKRDWNGGREQVQASLK
jgi:hypothetical protein